MMALRAVSVQDNVVEFAKARARWGEVSAARRQLLQRLEDARAAVSLHNYSWAEGERRPEPILVRVQAFIESLGIPRCRVTHEHLIVALRDLERELVDGEDAYQEARSAWTAVLRKEQVRRLGYVRPALQAHARRIAGLVGQLSQEVAAARDTAAELGEVGAIPPDIGGEFGTLVEYHSVISRWNRRMLAESWL